MTKNTLTQFDLKSVLDYDKKTGIFTWKSNARKVNAGNVAGSDIGTGYIGIGLHGKKYLAHRLAFLWMTGKFPAEMVDHINGIRNDNSWRNIRLADSYQNSQNKIRYVRKSKTGIPGVFYGGKAFRTQIGDLGKSIHIGCFPTKDAAHKAYVAAKKKLHPFSTV